MTNTPDEPPIRVLLVDDDREDYLLTRDLVSDLPQRPYQLDWVSDYDAGLKAIQESTHDVYLLDYRLGARDGLELLIEGRKVNPSAPMILLTGCGEWEIDRLAVQSGAADYLEKGRLDPTILERSIRHALLQKRYEAQLEHKVRERTAELESLNQDLHREIAVRLRAEAALREADKRKDEFLATLAHELRNPLAPIRNALEIMRLSEGKPETIAQTRKIIERQVNQMVRLIDDLLDVSRITRGTLQIVKEQLSFQEVIEAALEISRPLIEKSGLTLTTQIPAEPILMEVDRVRMAQVISNLLNNSARYSDSGGSVLLAVEQRDAQLSVRVRDMGIGISQEFLPKVFDLFTQVDRAHERTQGGLGIGLALVRQLVTLHGGEVTARSPGVGQGAEFELLLPIAK